MDNSKRFRDCVGNIGSLGSVVCIYAAGWIGVTHYVVDIKPGVLVVRQCYRGRKNKEIPFSFAPIHIVNRKI